MNLFIISSPVICLRFGFFLLYMRTISDSLYSPLLMFIVIFTITLSLDLRLISYNTRKSRAENFLYLTENSFCAI